MILREEDEEGEEEAQPTPAAAGPSDDSSRDAPIDRNTLISLLGGKHRLPPKVQHHEPDTISLTVAREVEISARKYKAAFASRTPRLAQLAASTTDATRSGKRDVAQPRHQWMARIDAVVVHDPARKSCTFLSQPRIAQPPVRKAVLRSTVLEGLPRYRHRGTRLSPRHPLPATRVCSAAAAEAVDEPNIEAARLKLQQT